MPKTKTKEWINTVFSLDPKVKEKIKEIAEFENMSRTEFIEFLVKNWDAGINPVNKLNLLMVDRKKLKLQMDKLDFEIERITTHIKLFEEWKKQKSKKKGQAIEIIKKYIINQDFEDAERIAKTWQRMTGVPAIELLFEANQEIRRSGI